MLLPISLKHLIVEKLIYSNKWCSFRKTVQKMAKVKDIRNAFYSRREADTLVLVASAINDVSQSELLIVENKIKSRPK